MTNKILALALDLYGRKPRPDPAATEVFADEPKSPLEEDRKERVAALAL
jgi:hypothetical protein